MKSRRAYRTVREFLDDTRMEQRELAALVQCSPSLLCRIVNGSVSPGFRLACRIAEVARVPVQSMLPIRDGASDVS